MRQIRIGTDCSGIEAPIEALKQLGIKYSHEWSSEIDVYARKSSLANYKSSKLFFKDMTKRNHHELPDIDLYICGFPCQSFSSMGQQLGLHDKRATIIDHCLQVIKVKQPKYFILENVKGFVSNNNGKTFTKFIKILESNGSYSIYHKILNTNDYGIPQNRQRIYIVGIKKPNKTFNFPTKTRLKPFDTFLLDHSIHEFPHMHQFFKKNIKSSGAGINTNHNWIVTGSGFSSALREMSPTLITNCKYYLTKYKRFLSPHECLLLQGFSKKFKQVVSNTQLYKQAGNAMSVNVLKAIYKSLGL